MSHVMLKRRRDAECVFSRNLSAASVHDRMAFCTHVCASKCCMSVHH